MRRAYLRLLREDVDILKGATAFFVRERALGGAVRLRNRDPAC
ncbi:hypothetical protein Sros_0047 [Streptosporangium roseum DSM 43021]|uniref:Uncharacterized protein n=1 Tax=Streptosporangium roseum (strain ATCC 12428 / DSM 43021 / JCM 3005 / KCTC 9067 / NCIMB 10171 / NRRL 2505 / NI 9100) TaxID=479432 RepID=D2AVY7_STRRD|nr:hypothetical protein Sros_0047 [Streptosporangium roseum DSM 43021]